MSTRFVIATLAASLPLLFARAALADEPSPTNEDAELTARRLRVERAEEALKLRKREVSVASDERALDRIEAAMKGPSPLQRERFSRAGRIVLPRLAGFSIATGSTATLGAGLSGIVSFSSVSSDLGSPNQSTSTISFSPSVDVFATDHWTVGGLAQVFHSTLRYSMENGPGSIDMKSSGYGVSLLPRVGRTFDLGAVTFWPKLSVGYGVNRVADDANQAPGRALNRSIYASIDVDVVFRLAPNVIFDVGPTFAYAHTSGESNRSIDRGDGDADNVSAGVQSHLGVTF